MKYKLVPSAISGAFWILAVLASAILVWRFQQEATSFNGIAEAAENIVSAESAVEILSISVVPGQQVKVGDTLVKLRRPELEVRIGDITRQLHGAAGNASRSNLDVDRRVSLEEANFEARRAQLLAEIRTLTEQRARNQALVSSFRGPNGHNHAEDSASDPILLRIQALHKQIAVEESGLRSQVVVLKGSEGTQHQASQDLQESLRKELALLQEEQRRLAIVSGIDGVVGNVNFRPGEKVAPFSPIATLAPRNPTLVHGYIHEKVYNSVGLGDSVEVASSGERSGTVKGLVVGVGARILEFPLRLRKYPQVSVWGREITVRIPERNPFLLGEMVALHRCSAAKAAAK
jgi:multidrug resistance efflux pump